MIPNDETIVMLERQRRAELHREAAAYRLICAALRTRESERHRRASATCTADSRLKSVHDSPVLPGDEADL